MTYSVKAAPASRSTATQKMAQNGAFSKAKAPNHRPLMQLKDQWIDGLRLNAAEQWSAILVSCAIFEETAIPAGRRRDSEPYIP
jgi:hypothetical protein